MSDFGQLMNQWNGDWRQHSDQELVQAFAEHNENDWEPEFQLPAPGFDLPWSPASDLFNTSSPSPAFGGHHAHSSTLGARWPAQAPRAPLNVIQASLPYPYPPPVHNKRPLPAPAPVQQVQTPPQTVVKDAAESTGTFGATFGAGKEARLEQRRVVDLKRFAHDDFLRELLQRVGADDVFEIGPESTFAFRFWGGGKLVKEHVQVRKPLTVKNKEEFDAFKVRHCATKPVHIMLDKADFGTLRALDADKRASFMQMPTIGGKNTKVPQERNLDASQFAKAATVLRVKHKWACHVHGTPTSDLGCYRNSDNICRQLTTQQVVQWANAIDAGTTDERVPPNTIVFNNLGHFKAPAKKRTPAARPDSSSSSSEPSSDPPDVALSSLEPFLKSFDAKFGRKTFDNHFTLLDEADFLPTIFAESHKNREYKEMVEVGVSLNNAKALSKYAFEVEEAGGGKKGKGKRRKV
ncbi:hypothetical protein P7C70_g8669, partial [Phenoliferia sp. Uapishka_3]